MLGALSVFFGIAALSAGCTVTVNNEDEDTSNEQPDGTEGTDRDGGEAGSAGAASEEENAAGADGADEEGTAGAGGVPLSGGADYVNTLDATSLTITVDGDPSDWTGTAGADGTLVFDGTTNELIYNDPTGDDLGDGDYTAPTNAAFNDTESDIEEVRIAHDGTNLYVVDTSNQCIRKVAIGGTYDVTTFAGWPSMGFDDGTGTAARFYNPWGVTTDGTNLYVTDTNNFTIRKIVMSTAEVTTLAGTVGTSGYADGNGAAATFSYPHGLTTDGISLYVTNTYTHMIRKID